MLRERDIVISPGSHVNHFGISMTKDQYKKIQEGLDLLLERCPSNSSMELNFKFKENSSLLGTLSINSLTESFYSEKTEMTPLSCYKLLESDIDRQLVDWKSRRFNKEIYGHKLNSYRYDKLA
ncbi:hypothetical protein [Halobacteriovorax sp.]|uniref:hypothetical protein n=1 Tax=Halobacteriovorax sp. TaxID=2020862 RepID=UPI0035686782